MIAWFLDSRSCTRKGLGERRIGSYVAGLGRRGPRRELPDEDLARGRGWGVQEVAIRVLICCQCL